MNPRTKILVFDSGAGGLTVAKELLQRLPDIELVYATDKTFFPYGDKEDAQLTLRIETQIEKLLHAYTPDLIVVACNTASTIALPILRARFTQPFVGVVPAIKPAASSSKSGVIGVLATPATSTRQYTRDLISEFAQSKKVIVYGSRALVVEAEREICGEGARENIIAGELNQLFTQPYGDSIDTIVLACTHFPLLKEPLRTITQAQNRSITWVDSGEAIARRAASLLKLSPNETQTTTKPPLDNSIHIVDCSGEAHPNNFAANALQYLKAHP